MIKLRRVTCRALREFPRYEANFNEILGDVKKNTGLSLKRPGPTRGFARRV